MRWSPSESSGTGRDPRGLAERAARAASRRSPRSPTPSPRSSSRGRERGRRGRDRRRGALRRRGARRSSSSAATSSRPRATRRRPGRARGDRARRARTSSRVAEAEAKADLRVTLPQGQSVRLRSVPVGSAGAYAPGGTASYPSSALMCTRPGHGRRGRAHRRRKPARGRTGRSTPSMLAAAAIGGRGAGLRDRRRAGDRRDGARHGVDRARRRHRRPGQPLRPGGQAPARRRASASTASPGPSELMVVFDELRRAALARARPLRAGRARRRRPAGGRERRRRGARRARAPGRRAAGARRDSVADAAARVGRGTDDRGRARARQRDRPRAPPDRLRDATSRAAITHRRVRVRGQRAAPPPSATTPPAPTTCCPRAARGASTGRSGPTVFRRRIATVRVTQDAARELAPAVATLARVEGFPVHAESVEARLETTQRRRDDSLMQPPHSRDQP